MTKAEIRALRARVLTALRWADRRLLVAHNYIVAEIPAAERDSRVMLTSRTVRDRMDPVTYIVEYDPEQVAGTSLRNLRILAGHEALHALLWPLGGSGGKEEPIVYCLQRALFGEVRE